MKVLFTCGGTAGHVNPALALAGLIKERKPESEILFVGARRGLEKQLVEAAGWPFRTVEISSFHRSLAPRELKHNLITVKNLLRSPAQARAILEAFPADLVVGTGGYASYPLVKAAAKRKIPTAVHESNAVPGLTTQMLETYADRIMVGFESCRKHYRRPEKVVVTGPPVRGDFFRLTKAEAKKRLGVDGGKPLIVSFWGSQGAAEMNRQTARFLALEAREVPFHHVHAAGKLDSVHMAEYLKGAGVDLTKTPELDVREYIQDMGTYHQRADRPGGPGHHRALPQRHPQPPGAQRPGPRGRRRGGDAPGAGVQRREALRHRLLHPPRPGPPPPHERGHGGAGKRGRLGENLRRRHGPLPPKEGKVAVFFLPHTMD